ncbi:MAG: SH3 domain-containing protein [Bacteriovoracaceae bacterium]
MDELLKTVTDHYTKAEYDKGIDLLLKNKEKFDSGLFHYNLGTFFLKKENYAVARFHLEKAAKLGFLNKSLYNNLSYAQDKLNVTMLEKSDKLLENVLYSFLDYGSTLYLNVALFLGVVILVCQRLKIINSKLKVMVLIFLFFIPFLFSIYSQKNYKYAIILKASDIREGPSGIFPKTREVAAGLKVIVDRTVDGWSFIKYPDSAVGWIDKNEIGIY